MNSQETRESLGYYTKGLQQARFERNIFGLVAAAGIAEKTGVLNWVSRLVGIDLPTEGFISVAGGAAIAMGGLWFMYLQTRVWRRTDRAAYLRYLLEDTQQ